MGVRVRLLLAAGLIVAALDPPSEAQTKETVPLPDTSMHRVESFRLEPLFLRPTLPFLLSPAAGGAGDAILLRQSLFQAGTPGRDLERNLSTMHGMWSAEVLRGKEYQTLWNIVGAVEAGAVGYLAYRHIKRYGLK